LTKSCGDARMKNYCTVDTVFFRCKDLCGLCSTGVPTVSPTLSPSTFFPTVSPTPCADKIGSFTYVGNSGSTIGPITCARVIEVGANRFCGIYSEVDTHCPSTCGLCPSEAPSAPPSLSPTTLSPTLAPTTCRDKIGSVTFISNGQVATLTSCQQLVGSNQVAKKCGNGPGGVEAIKLHCPATCGICPTSVPSIAPTVSHSPTLAPTTLSPTLSPTTCGDRVGDFVYSSNGSDVTTNCISVSTSTTKKCKVVSGTIIYPEIFFQCAATCGTVNSLSCTDARALAEAQMV